ncbi:FAD-binding oxidoreductase [Xenorhabdus nematophila]|uniref:NAD(P)/FAD-dependent oxidoreductase n=1 Tax=Xenorhabdus nematophila TaxID=628 RepID=UPI0032B7C6D4
MTRQFEFDCIIIGAGIIGATCFHQFTAAGKRCLLLEQRQLSAGITGASGCIVRVSHRTNEAIDAAALGFHFYQKLSHDSAGYVPFTRKGYLHFADEETLLRIHERLLHNGIRAEILTQASLRHQYPDFPVIATSAIYEPDSGYMDAKPTLEFLVQSAVVRGGQYLDAVELQQLLWDQETHHVNGVMTSMGEFYAPNIVLAMGNATIAFLQQHFSDDCGMWNQLIQVTRFTHDVPLSGAPCFIDDLNELNGRWCSVTGGFFAGYPTGLRVPSNDSYRSVDKSHALFTQQRAQQRFPWLKGASTNGALCHSDCYSQQSIGVIGEQASLPKGIFVASGFSGGGFKMAPYVAATLLPSITGLQEITTQPSSSARAVITQELSS